MFSDVDETADEVDGELYDGSFVRTANVRVEEVRQDGMGRTWLLIRYLYGEEEPDGEMAWTDTATVWVLAEETQPSDAADYDVTLKNKVYKGETAGAGLTYGYSFVLSNRQRAFA